jgi:hypothetical protein
MGGANLPENLPNLQYILIGVVVLVVIVAYLYRDQLRNKMESLLLWTHLGKPNEIQTTEIPPASRLASVIEGLGLAEEIQPI